MVAKTVETLLEDIQLLEGDQYVLVQKVRSLIAAAVPKATESVKYGGIVFSVNSHFCGVFAYKNHVSVEFSDGARIEDTLGNLEGKGKGRRHLKLHTLDDIDRTALAHYIPLAVQAAQR